MREVDIISMTKAVLWEEAKGKLRALVKAHGSEHTTPVVGEDYPFTKVQDAVENFIRDFEDKGHEE